MKSIKIISGGNWRYENENHYDDITRGLFHYVFHSEGNTVKGVGKDIEKAGEAIQRTAKP